MELSEKLRNLLQELPKQCCGVYFCYDAQDELIYIGKSINVRKRMQQHFQSKQAKEVRLQTLVHRIAIEDTGNELIALLRESELIKQHKPILNRAQRKTRFFYALYAQPNADGYLALTLEKTDPTREAITAFTTLAEGKNFLFAITDRYQLCQKINGLYKTKSQCFQFTLKTCKGACIQKEEVELYNARVNQFLDFYVLPPVDFLFEVKGRTANEKGLVWIEKGIYKGFGFGPIRISEPALLKTFIEPKEDNKDIRRILFRHMRKDQLEWIDQLE